MTEQRPDEQQPPEQDGGHPAGQPPAGPPGAAPDPGQRWPAPPYPGPGYGAPQPYPGQAYPGQPYPGQPYGAPQPYPGQQQYGGPPPYPPQSWPPPAPPYAGPPQQAWPAHPHPEPREYHQMLRTWTYAWWKPVLGIVLVMLGMVIVAPLALMPVLMIGVAIEGGPFWESFEQAASLQAIGPASLLYLNLTLGSTILVCWFVMRYLHKMRPRWLTSVAPKMRWRFFFACLGLSVVALVAQIVAGSVLPGSGAQEPSGEVNEFTSTTAVLALIVLLTTPLQAAGEEYVFRGYLMQALGSLFRYKWIALLVTSTLFAMAHGVQNFPLFFDRFMFGLIAGWLVLRTGGLEAGIAMHILNNFLAFGYALTYADLTETLNVSEAGWGNVPLTLVQSGTYAVLVLLVTRKMGLRNRTDPPLPASPAAPSSGVERVPSGA